MKIAIIGSGISGMGAAYLLNKRHDITLYEKEPYIGGHSRTLDVQTPQGTVAVDTGFIVFNRRNYPNLVALFDALDVPVAPSSMSFGVSIGEGDERWLEYSTQTLFNIFAQKRNLLRPRFFRMLLNILRFNKQAKAFVENNPDETMEVLLEKLNMGQWFKHYYLLAMGGAIWSTPTSEMFRFPAKTMVQFFENHGLLTVNDQPQWYTVQGGSREYVARLTASFKEKINLNRGVASVQRQDEGVRVKDLSGKEDTYDHVLFACHSDQALALIANPSAEEKNILGAIGYQPNRLITHSDVSFMPKRKKAWASWVYLSDRQHQSPAMSLTYWMNNLQPLGTDYPVLVTLNPTRDPDPALTYDEHIFEHPLFDQPALAAQQRIGAIQGKDRLWFCGAWQRYGFHEDGLSSAIAVAQQFGVEFP